MALERKDIEAKYKWDLSAIYESVDAFNADFKRAEGMISDFKKHEKTITTTASALYDALSDMAAIGRLIEKLWSYAHLNFATNTSDNTFQALSGRVRSLAVSADSAAWFVNPYILRLDEKIVEAWFSELPKLETFRRMIEK
jgi:oligoendopeptidase F